MLFRKILKIGAVSAGLLILAACTTGKEELLGEGGFDTDTGPSQEKVSVSGTGDTSNFDEDETCDNPLKVGNQTYYFSFDSSVIHTADLASLKVQTHYLVRHPKTKVLISGNTDERGSREYNIGLGQRRALSVERFLRSNGVNRDQLLTVSYGAEKPVALGHSEEDYAKNRRVNLQYQTPIITDEG